MKILPLACLFLTTGLLRSEIILGGRLTDDMINLTGNLSAKGVIYQRNTAAIFPSTATATASVSNGRITAINLNSGGAGYLHAPSVLAVGGGGTGAAFRPVIGNGGTLTSIEILSGGRGFTSAPNITIENPPGLFTAVWATGNPNPMTMDEAQPLAEFTSSGNLFIQVPDSFSNGYSGPFYTRLSFAPTSAGPFQPLGTDIPITPTPFVWKADRGLALGGRTRNTTGHSLGVASVSTNRSIAIGSNARADGLIGNTSTIALGYQTYASKLGIAMGYQSASTGGQAPAQGSAFPVAAGYRARAIGPSSAAFGYQAEASGESAHAFGSETIASGDSAKAFGIGTVANSFGEIAFGRYNRIDTPASTTEWNESDTILAVGNGSSDANRSNAFEVHKNGYVGINTLPEARLHVKATSDSVSPLLEWVPTSSADQIYHPVFFQQFAHRYESSHFMFYSGISFEHGDTLSGPLEVGRMAFRQGNTANYFLRFDLGGLPRMWLAEGYLQVTGTLNQGSDIQSKTNLTPADTAVILSGLRSLPLHQWSYKNDPLATPHLGPMAQDFHASFGLGKDDVTISTIDRDGVVLASLKALKSESDTRAALIEANARTLSSQDALIEKLQVRLSSLESLQH